MRNLIALLLLLSICNFSIASNQASSKVHWNKYEPEKVTVNDIITNKSYLNLSEFDHLKLRASSKDELGFTHHTYTQFHKKIPVENAVIKIHEKSELVSLTNGSTAHNFNVNTTPSINETSALKMALDFVNAKIYAWEVVEYEQALCKVSNNTTSTFYPVGKLVWYKSTNSNIDAPYKLTYKFDVYSIEPNMRQYIYVDADNGNVIESINRIANCTNTLATGETNYYNTVGFSACEEHGIYHLKNIDNTHIEVFDAKQTRFTYQSEVTDTDNHFEENKAANEVFWASQNIYQYFKETFNRNSIDDEGMSILSWVNYANEAGNRNSAFWNGDWMTFGSGDGKHYNSRTSTDIVAHELMHGINDFTANLMYKNESGALDESFSDIFGEVIEAYVKGSNDWLIGAETIADSSKTALRSLSNPKDNTIFHQQPDTYKGEYWWTSIEDNGGVHYNSGVQNYWFYLLAEGGSGINDNNYAYNIEPIGIDKAAAIAYRNLTYYLTPYSNFEDAKNGAIQAATELYGVDSNEAKQTELAWRAVGIGQQNDEPLPGIEPTPNDNIDSIALINLYNATNLNNTWVNDWDLTKPMDQWYGVEIFYSTRRVFRLQLSGNGLSGNIPDEIGQLTALTELDLSKNELTGSIPSSIDYLTKLEYLDLSSNQFGGLIPDIGIYTLYELKLNNNQLEGNLHSIIDMDRLKLLDVSNNNLSGSLYINTYIYPTLLTLNISNNKFAGKISTKLIKLKKVENLLLNDNLFEGELPGEYALNPNIKKLHLQNNLFTGCINNNFSKLCNNNNIDFKIGDNNLDNSWSNFCTNNTGVCPVNPCRIEDSLNLMILVDYIDRNNWEKTKPIDDWWGIRRNADGCVVEIHIGEDDEGVLPPEIGNFKYLEVLNTDESSLTGPIPPEIGLLSELKNLNLSESNFIGKVPSEISNLKKLEYINLYENQLTGSILFLENMLSVRWCNLSKNYFSGPFPLDIANEKNIVINHNNFFGCYPEEAINLCDKFDDYDISINNNFDISWSEFCEQGVQACASFPSCRTKDSLTLVKIHQSLSNNEDDYAFWNFDTTIDTWNGVTLNEFGCVSELKFFENPVFYGSLPPEIGDLQNLETLIIYDCFLPGEIPAEIGNLPLLTILDFQWNELSGEIPKEIGNLNLLEDLNFNGNQLSGEIPDELEDNNSIKSLNLSSNNLSGEIPINIWYNSKLKFLDLSGNNLTGGLPYTLGNFKTLDYLDVRYNQLSATCLNSNLKKLCNAEVKLIGENTNLEQNNFNTTWDDFCSYDIGNCSNYETCRQTDSLTLVKLGENLKNYYGEDIWPTNKPIDNWPGITLNEEGCVKDIQFIETGLQGFLSPEIGDLKSLEKLLIIDSNLSGEIPREIGNLTKLNMLGLSWNNLEGQIPNEITQLTKLNSLDLSLNNLTGGIPAAIGNLVNLTYIDVAENNLGGTLPPSLANLTKLHALTINDNNMEGCFPAQLTKLCSQFTQPQAIDTGNNFEATWDDFCNSSAGACPEIITCRQTDSLTLVKIHEHLKGNGNNFWDFNTPIDTWEGIELNEEGCVEWFQFGPQHNLNFNTNLPPQIADLKSLELLHLTHCNLTGEIPKEIANLTQLEILSLGSNQLQGNIPQELEKLKKLNVLTLENNKLIGSIPFYIGEFDNLGWLELNDNQLTGSIPASFADSQITILNIGNNNLSGCYAPELNKLCSQLDPDEFHRVIDEGNNFDATWDDFCNSGAGACFETVATCRQTDSLTLIKIHNHLKGNGNDFWDLNTPIDTWRGVILNEEGCVYWLETPQPNLNFNTSIPIEIADLRNLEFLGLYNCGLTGNIPIEITNLDKLQILVISNNNLTGTIPKEIANLRNLDFLQLINNNLEGNIPSELAQINQFEGLELQGNNLTGSIPASFADSDMYVLNVANNNLAGCYAPELNKLCNQLYKESPFPSIIDEGNNFDATWDDFCNSGAGVCVETVATCRQTDSLTLIKVHNQLKGENGNSFWSWDTPIDTWEGIALNEDGCVKELFLSNKDFRGNLPPEIGDLQNLEYLKIINCWTGGEIPKEIGNLSKLVSLELEWNFLSGNIPKEIMQLKNLFQLDLSYNNLQGSIPQNIDELSKLSILNLKHNDFRGGLPASLANLNEIAFIDVTENYLTGCFAPILKQICDDTDVTVQVDDYFDASWEDFCNSGAGACIDTVATCRQTDSLTLLKIHEHLKGKNGDNFWPIYTPLDTWEGILTLNDDGCVKQITCGPQHNLNFNTNLPPEIGDLKSLEGLIISYCNLTGEIPIEIGNLPELDFLSLGNNQLEGSIPNELAQLKKLNALHLGNNNFQGNIPSYIGEFEYLSWLELNDNNLSGIIPVSFKNSNVNLLNIGNNNLSGCYNLELSNLCEQLDMSFPSIISEGNNFDATWDDFCNSAAGACTEIETCRQTDSLNLLILADYINQPSWDKTDPIDTWSGIKRNTNGCVTIISIWEDVTGTLPPEIGNFSELEYLFAVDSRLTGSIPSEIGQLTNLIKLDLYDSGFTGNIPAEIGSLVNLTYLDLEENALTGNVPIEISNLKNLNYLSLEFNYLTGDLNSQLSGLSNLEYLNLAENEFTGSISFLENMPLLDGCDLADNAFSGTFPLDLATQMKLSIGTNNFSGCYPVEAQILCSKYTNYKISNGNNFDATWDDFCNTSAGICTKDNETVIVWPGDMDNNGIVNSNDLLYYGLATSRRGEARENTTTKWLGQEVPKWNNIIAGINGAYQDANGNGIVDTADVAAIISNYNKTHIINDVENISNPLSLNLDPVSSVKYNGFEELTFDLYAKNTADGAPTIYGLSANINFSDLPVIEINVDFSQSSLKPTEHLSYFNTTTGVLDLSLTRTDKNNVIVAEPLARLIVIIDDYPTGDPYDIKVEGGSFATVNGGLNGIGSSSFYGNHNTSEGVSNSLQVYVNTINQQCNSKGAATAIINGGVQPYSIKWNNGSSNETLNNLEADAYSLHVTDAVGNTTQTHFIIYGTPPVYNQNGALICGTTCPDYLSPTATTTSKVFKSAQILNSSSAYTQKQTIEFSAGDTITLDKGFYINPDVDFSATIEQCE